MKIISPSFIPGTNLLYSFWALKIWYYAGLILTHSDTFITNIYVSNIKSLSEIISSNQIHGNVELNIGREN